MCVSSDRQLHKKFSKKYILCFDTKVELNYKIFSVQRGNSGTKEGHLIVEYL